MDGFGANSWLANCFGVLFQAISGSCQLWMRHCPPSYRTPQLWARELHSHAPAPPFSQPQSHPLSSCSIVVPRDSRRESTAWIRFRDTQCGDRMSFWLQCRRECPEGERPSTHSSHRSRSTSPPTHRGGGSSGLGFLAVRRRLMSRQNCWSCDLQLT